MSVGGSPDSGWLHETRPERAQRTAAPKTPGSGKLWVAALAALALVFAGLSGYDLFTNRHLLAAKPIASPAASASASRRSVAFAAASPSASENGGASAIATGTARGSPTASSPATVAPARVLTAVSAVAFGPDGTSDGDNPGIASRVLTGDGAWESSWYETAEFGNLQTGTGLLLDMGGPVSVSSVRLELGATQGADVHVRLGDTPELSDLSTAASGYDVGGAVHLALQKPVRARYVLVWFTLLPPDAAGTYQVSVDSVTVDGRS